MEYSLQTQAGQFLCAGAVGIALGLHYDLLRAVRRIHPRLTVPADLWFCLTALGAMLALALYGGGGQLHLFMLIGSFLGACVWFAGPGRSVLRFFTAAAGASVRFRQKIKKICKKTFSNAKKSVKIIAVKMGSAHRRKEAMQEMRIKFKKSSLITKIVIMVLLVYAMIVLVSLQRQLSQKQAERAVLETQLTEQQQENAALHSSIDALDTDEGVEAVAREKLGLVSEGEITFYDAGN